MTRPTTHGLVVLVVLFGAVAPLAGAVTAADAPEFEESVVTTSSGEAAEIAVAVPDGTSGPVTVEIGSEEANFLVNATVADADGDGTVALRLDTTSAGEGEPDSYLSVAGDDGIESAEQVTPEIEPPLDPGDYELALHHDERVDVGTLVVSSPETTADPGAGTSLVYEGDRITLSAAEGQAVRGETTLDPDSSVVVQIRSSEATNPFLKSVETTVSEDGTFGATFDLSDISEGAAFQVVVRANGSELASAEGQVGCENGCPTTASPTATTFAPTTAAPSDGGFLASLGPLGAMALGAVLAVVGVGVLLGVFRT